MALPYDQVIPLKFFSSSFNFKTKGEVHFVDITSQIQEIVRRSEIGRGMAFIFSPHATGAIILNENDQSLLEDFKEFLEHLVPRSRSYRHPVNAHSHIRSIFMEPSKVIPVKDGELLLGTWQSIIWVELDTRPRTRTVIVTVLGE